MAWDNLSLPKKEGGLRFRNLYAFNLALLAKQGCRIIQEPTSLVSIFKAKYFPHSSFLEVGVRSNASYAWRSICAAREVILWGSRWQIGDGTSIMVWGDRWLPLPSTFRLFSPKSQECYVNMVSELSEDARWQLDMLGPSISIEEMDAIRSIPLSIRRTNDRLIWHYNNEVCSLWKANVPPKVKMAAWRIISNIIPIGDNLHKQHVPLDPACILCWAESETVWHLMIEYSFARCTWLASPIGLRPGWHYLEDL